MQLKSVAMLKYTSSTGSEVNEADMDVSHLENLSDIESESFGSDSSVSDGLPMQLLHTAIPEVFTNLLFVINPISL